MTGKPDEGVWYGPCCDNIVAPSRIGDRGGRMVETRAPDSGARASRRIRLGCLFERGKGPARSGPREIGRAELRALAPPDLMSDFGRPVLVWRMRYDDILVSGKDGYEALDVHAIQAVQARMQRRCPERQGARFR